MRKSTEIFEDFINSLETMIDLQDDGWDAIQNGKWRKRDEIYDDKLPDAKRKFKQHLDEYLDRRFETFLEKRGK